MRKQHDDYKIDGSFTKMKPIGSLPNRCFGSNKNNVVFDNDVRRCNRYLKWQSDRIFAFIAAGKMQAGLLVWCLLAKNSKAYQLYLFNKVNKNWYWKRSEAEVWKSLLIGMNKMRTWNLRTYITRYYILKKNGKFRPIGAPDIPSKMLCRFLSDLCTYMLEGPRSGLEVSNHAYRPERGRHTAVIEILENYVTNLIKYKKFPIIKEIDFKGYFNNVNWRSILVSIDRLTNSDLSSLVLMYLKNTKVQFKELKEEAELVKVGEHRKKPIVVRKGLPQGSPVSPVLATIACDMSAPPKGLTMYADDGVFIGNDLAEFDDWLRSGEESGRIVEHEKTKVLDINTPLKFCGFEIDFKNDIITNENKESIDLFTPRDILINFLKRGNLNYGDPRQIPRWEWDVHHNSFAVHHKVSIFSLNILVSIPTIFFGIFRLEYMGYKWIPFMGIYHVTTTSSECMKRLCSQIRTTKNLSELKLIRDLKFDFNEKELITDKPKNNKHYLEFNPQRIREDLRKIIPGISIRDLMLSTRSMIGSARYVKLTWEELRRRIDN